MMRYRSDRKHERELEAGAVQRIRSEVGDTLVEILLAITVIGFAGVALLSAFTTAISASSEYKNLSSLDSVLKTFVENTTYQLEYHSPSAFKACATVNSDGTGDYQGLNTTQGIYSLKLVGIEYWTSSNAWSTNPALCNTQPPSQELLTAQVQNTANSSSETIQFAVYAPGFAPANPAIPSFQSANNDIVAAPGSWQFAVTAIGEPSPGLSISLNPSWVTLIDDGGGNGTLFINPPANAATGSPYHFLLTATNGVGSTPQPFTLKISSAPAFTSANSDTISTSSFPPFTVTTTGTPTASLAASGLPAWATFTDNGDGTGTLSFTAPVPTGSPYSFTLTATNSGGSTPQPFTLIVSTTSPAAPVFTTSASDTVPTNEPLTFTVTATGVPTPSLIETGQMPPGISFAAGTGTSGTISGTLSGTPTNTTGSPVNYQFTFTAANSAGSTPQTFTLTVNARSTPTISYPTPTPAANQFRPTKSQPFKLTILGAGFICSTSGPSATVTWTGPGPLGVVCNNSGSITVSGTAPSSHSTSEIFTITNPDGGSVQTLTNAFETLSTG